MRLAQGKWRHPQRAACGLARRNARDRHPAGEPTLAVFVRERDAEPSDDASPDSSMYFVIEVAQQGPVTIDIRRTSEVYPVERSFLVEIAPYGD